MSTLFFDTETSDKLHYKLPADHPSQPRIVQLIALLEDDDGKEISSFNLIFKPDGWQISDDALSKHGIDEITASLYGVAPIVGLQLLSHFWGVCDQVVAHNIDFDNFMLDIENCRLPGGGQNLFPASGPLKPQYCTMKLMENICRIPLPFNKGGWNKKKEFKWPTLEEAHMKAMGQGFANPHSKEDVLACARVFRWLVQQGKVKL